MFESAAPDVGLWARILAVDERSHEYFAERQDLPGVALFTNPGAPPFNLAVIGNVPAEATAATLEDVVGHYHRLGLPARVRVTPLSRPSGWPERLASGGFSRLVEEEEQFMVRDGSPLEGGPGRVSVRRVEDEAALGEFVRVQQAGWETPPDEDGRALRLAQRSLSEGLYVYCTAYLDGRAVGAASARFAECLTGLYGLATVPEARRRGVGTALVKHITAAGAGRGCLTAFLSVEPGSHAAGLYRRLGFSPAFRVNNYSLTAGPAAAAG